MVSEIEKILESKNFQSAIKDVIYLYDRNYPEKTVIQAVGNRYRLSRQERMILYRGISKKTYRKSINPVEHSCIRQNKIIVDGFNVLITVESYLKGVIVFRGIDNITRDIAGIHSYKSRPEICRKAVSLLIDAFLELGPGFVTIIFDNPVSMSGEIADTMNRKFSESGIEGYAYTDKSPDYLLKNSDQVVCTSDSVIISSSDLVFDLPAFIIEHMLRKKIFSLSVK